MIPESFLEELKQRCDIEQIISAYVPLKRTGRTYKGLCPFHSEKTPSFVVYPESQSFYCFGCGAGGDVITFIRRQENLEYVEAVRFLAEKVGMTVPEDVAEDRTAKLRLRILEMNREAARFFHQNLVKGPDRRGLEYFASRGMDPKMITRFGLGYAPDGWNGLRDHLAEKRYSWEEMRAAALVSQGRNGSVYDTFRRRVIFPIIDLRGNVIGFGGRILGKEGGPKYLNSADTLAFKKSRNLFALNFAKNAGDKRLILCEGYMDTVSMHGAGFTNAVATLGTALTPEQARLISHYTDEVILAYDSDDAGQKATARAVRLFDEIGLKVKVLRMEGAKDPDEYIKKFGATRFKLLLDGSTNATEYAIDRLKEKYDLSTDDGKVRFLGELAALLAGVPNPVERDVYISRWANTLGVSAQALTEQVQSLWRRRKAGERKKRDGDLTLASQDVEVNRRDPQRARNIGYALAEDKLIAALWKNNDFYPFIKERIRPEDFVTDSNRVIFQELCRRLEENRPVTVTAFASVLDEALLSRLTWLLADNDTVRFDRQQVEDFIDKIRSRQLKKDSAEISGMDRQELDDYIKKLSEKKRG